MKRIIAKLALVLAIILVTLSLQSCFFPPPPFLFPPPLPGGHEGHEGHGRHGGHD